MNKDDIIEVLKKIKSEVREKYKANLKGIFGSYVRGEEQTESDIDILVEFEADADLIHFVGLSLFLEEKFGIKADIVPYDSLRAGVKDIILKETVYL